MRVGIDAEDLDRPDFTNLQELATRWLVGEEQKTFLASPTKETFLRIWTRKEAYVKYIGDGLRSLSKIDTVALENEGRIRFFDYREGTILISVCAPRGTDVPQFCKL
jgi:phosphopantetheinyl transferase